MTYWIPNVNDIVRVRESGTLVTVTSKPFPDGCGRWRVQVYEDWGDGRGLYCPADVGALEAVSAPPLFTERSS